MCIIASFFWMSLNPKFGPAAQTPAQRAEVLARMQDAIPHLKRNLTATRQQLYARYVAGELSWLEVKQLIDNAQENKGSCLHQAASPPSK